jgi:hypothetical protein
MSERRERKKYRETVEQELRGLREQQQAIAQRISAQEKALEVLSEVPKVELHCNVHQAWAPRNGVLESVWCSEHQQLSDQPMLLGPETLANLKFCPVCGAKVDNVVREHSPYERNAKATAQRAAGSLQLAGSFA